MSVIFIVFLATMN